MLDIRSESLYELVPEMQDVMGLRALRPDAAAASVRPFATDTGSNDTGSSVVPEVMWLSGHVLKASVVVY